MIRQNDSWECTACGYSSVKKTNVANHVESKHVVTNALQFAMDTFALYVKSFANQSMPLIFINLNTIENKCL